MDSTTQWSISWNMALCPPQEMLPPESLFRTAACDSPPSTNIEHLFGFAPCVSPPYTENSPIVSSLQDTIDIQNLDIVYETYEDFQAVL